MKKNICILLMLCLFVPVSIKASAKYNFTDIKSYINAQISNYYNYSNYFAVYTVGFNIPFKYLSGTLSYDSRYYNSGLLNYSEYQIAGVKNSYLYDANQYWTMTEGSSSSLIYIVDSVTSGFSIQSSSNLYGFRPTLYIKSNVEFNGLGTYNNPFVLK